MFSKNCLCKWTKYQNKLRCDFFVICVFALSYEMKFCFNDQRMDEFAQFILL